MTSARKKDNLAHFPAARDPSFENLYALVTTAGVAEGWKVFKRSGDIQLLSKKYRGFPFKAVVARCVIRAPPEICFARYWDDESKKEWNPKLIETQLISEPSPDRRIVYQSVKVPWPLDTRDFVFEHRFQHFEDGSYFAWAHSTEHGAFPPLKKLVRGHMYFSCGHFTPATDPDGSTVTLCSTVFLFDPKGLVPPWIINVSSGQFTDIVELFRQCCLKDYAAKDSERRIRLPTLAVPASPLPHLHSAVSQSAVSPVPPAIGVAPGTPGSSSLYNTQQSDAGTDDFRTADSFSDLDALVAARERLNDLEGTSDNSGTGSASPAHRVGQVTS